MHKVIPKTIVHDKEVVLFRKMGGTVKPAVGKVESNLEQASGVDLGFCCISPTYQC